ncbi:restriction endonuclease [Pseudomaricurvus alcaniphilus]|nr:restriction endonuclease [Pseudomaricurvus alcaniphilus]
MRPLLEAVSDGEVHAFNEAFDRICAHFQLTEGEITEKLPSGKQTVIRNRVAWARTYMNKAGLLTSPGRAQVQITDRGLQALADKPDRVTVAYLKQYPEFVEFHTAKPKPVVDSSPSGDGDSDTDPLERLEQAHGEIQDSLAGDLLELIKQQPPQFLENLVVELLQAMGYGGWSETSGAATQYTSDGGIDGVINEDPLGLETIYLQAKRYTDNTVSRPDVQAFVGALEMRRSRKGVYITTSRFSREAEDYINMIEKKVVLIDGKKLAQLMIGYNLGVSVKSTYQVKSIDTDYFEQP